MAAPGLVWNDEQLAVIQAPPAARLVVDAGPGSGKTATAAGRIVALLEHGVPPSHLWAISFSRAAVAEMRARLALLGGTGLALPRTTTLDSLAWHLREGGEDDGVAREGYDPAIAETLASLRAGDPAIMDRVARMEHFVIDESQDLVGQRALLVAGLIDALPARCGVTILTDEAQAIYGFSAGALAASFDADTLARHFLERADSRFALHHLRQIHRTGDKRLLRLFGVSRALTLKETPDPKRKLARVRRRVKRYAHARRLTPADAGTLILYRSRAEVLAAARERAAAGLAYRLRLSGLPLLLLPWVATLLHDCGDLVLPRWKFDDLWAERLNEAPGREKAWTALCEALGKTEARAIEIRALLQTLRGGNPPPGLSLFDPGDENGPVIGTIHASKGRESERVQLMMPQGYAGRDDPDAEARVLFVGATRARNRLEVGRGPRLSAKRVGDGRVYLPLGPTSAEVEIGRHTDFMWMEEATAIARPCEFRLHITSAGIQLCAGVTVVATGSSLLDTDLREIRTRLAGTSDYRQWSAQCGLLPCLGYGTLALNVKSHKTGLISVPILIGLVKVEFYVA